MKEGKTYRMYTHDDIRRYLNGEMSSMEMYALEKQAIEDPFLADAIDGYNSIISTAAQADLSALQNSLAQKQEAKVVSIHSKTTKKAFPWVKLSIAASVVGAVLYFGLRNINNTNKQDKVAANKPAAASATDNLQKSEDTVVAFNKLKTSEPNNEKTPAGAYVTPPKTSVFVKPDDLDKFYGESVKVDDNLSSKAVGSESKLKVEEKEKFGDTLRTERGARMDEALEGKISGEQVATKPAAPSAATKTPDVTKKEAAPVISQWDLEKDRRSNTVFNGTTNSTTTQQVFSDVVVTNSNTGNKRNQEVQLNRNYKYNYRIVDQQGNHIPFTNISVPADQLITYSRVDGRFGLFSADSVLHVNIKADGYRPQTLNLKSNDYYSNIVLTELPKADDKAVVIGDVKNFKTKAKSAKLVSQVEEAEPIDGLDNYDSYLANNINITEKPQGEVVLQFDINKNGDPTNIIVTQSLSQTADQEAIRLLSEGPKWKSKKRKKSKGKIVIKF